MSIPLPSGSWTRYSAKGIRSGRRAPGATPAFSALARRRKLMKFEARYADVSRRFEQLRSAGAEGVADLKVALEKAWDAFQSEIGSKP